jgi:hypothetical protein
VKETNDELGAALGELFPVLKEEDVMKRKKYPGRKPGSKTVTEEERKGIVADYKAGMLLPDLVEKYKRSKSTIWGTARRAGLPLRRSGEKKGEAMKMAKVAKSKKPSKPNTFLTADEHARIVEDYKSGAVLSTITEKYGRSRDSVLRAVRMAGVQLRGRGYAGNKIGLTKEKKKSMQAKIRKAMTRSALASSIDSANKALAMAHKNGDVVGRAVGALIKALEHEEIQEILIDFNLRQYKTTRLRVEEGRIS